MDHFDIEFEKIRQRYNCSDINKIELLRQQLSEGGGNVHSFYMEQEKWEEPMLVFVRKTILL